MSLVSDAQFRAQDRALVLLEKLHVTAEKLQQEIVLAVKDTADLDALQDRIKRSTALLLAQSTIKAPDLTPIKQTRAETEAILATHIKEQQNQRDDLAEQASIQRKEIEEQAKQIQQLKISIANVR